MDEVSEAGLYRSWEAFGTRNVWAGVVARGGDPAVAAAAVAELPEVSPLEALEANARLVGLLTGARWWVMQAAREAGASWTEIGAALGMTKQGARDWYRRKIGERERYAPEHHDATRARAALAGKEDS